MQSVILATVAIIAALGVGILTTSSADWTASFLLVWAVVLLFLSFYGGNGADRDWILGRITHRDNLGLYDRLTRTVIRTATRMISPKTWEGRDLPQNRVARAFAFLDIRARDRADLQRLQSSAFSWPVMDAAMKLAIIYPLFLLLVQWAWTNAPTGVAGVAVLEPASIWIRLALICPLRRF